MRAKIFIALMLLSFSSKLIAQTKADDIMGTWLTTGKEPAKIQIYKKGEMYNGKIIWLQNPTDEAGKAKTDINNPDKTKRSNSVIGMIILTNFKFNGDDEWRGGDIYDPESGNTYSSYIYLRDQTTLKVRGFVGISLFGRTETWSRVN